MSSTHLEYILQRLNIDSHPFLLTLNLYQLISFYQLYKVNLHTDPLYSVKFPQYISKTSLNKVKLDSVAPLMTDPPLARILIQTPQVMVNKKKIGCIDNLKSFITRHNPPICDPPCYTTISFEPIIVSFRLESERRRKN